MWTEESACACQATAGNGKVAEEWLFHARTRRGIGSEALQTCPDQFFDANDDFPWGKAIPVVAL